MNAPTFARYTGAARASDWRTLSSYWVRFNGKPAGFVQSSQSSTSSPFWSAYTPGGRLVASGCATRAAAAEALRPAPTA